MALPLPKRVELGHFTRFWGRNNYPQWSGTRPLGACGDQDRFLQRSYWMPGPYAPTLSEKRNLFLSLLKNKGFKKESRTKVGLYAISKSTTLESNKSLYRYLISRERLNRLSVML